LTRTRRGLTHETLLAFRKQLLAANLEDRSNLKIFRRLTFMSGENRILVVDDDADIRLGYHVLLKAHDYDISFASDAFSAVAEAHICKPRLIILDIGLPSVPRSEYTMPLPEPSGGFLVMERLQADIYLAAIPIIIVSGRDPAADRGRALRGGAKAFVQKPWNNDNLLAIISQLLGSRELLISRHN
jgi:CheY-like chemotaxis protein